MCIRDSVHPVACPSLALSRDARFLLTAADRAIKVWDYLPQSSPSCQVCAVVGAGGRRQAGQREGRTPCGDLLPGQQPGQAWVWEDSGVSDQASGVSVRDMRCPQVYIGHSEPVQAVAFTPDQQHLLSVGDAIFLWDILASAERSPPGRQVPLTCVCQASCCAIPA